MFMVPTDIGTRQDLEANLGFHTFSFEVEADDTTVYISKGLEDINLKEVDCIESVFIPNKRNGNVLEKNIRDEEFVDLFTRAWADINAGDPMNNVTMDVNDDQRCMALSEINSRPEYPPLISGSYVGADNINLRTESPPMIAKERGRL